MRTVKLSRLVRISSDNPGLFFALIDWDGQVLSFDQTKASLLGIKTTDDSPMHASSSLFPSLDEDFWPVSPGTLQENLFPRTEFYASVGRSVLWEAEFDEEHNDILLIGTAVQSTSHDISKFDLLTERLRRYDRFLANIPGVVYRCRFDDDWSMEFLNDAVEGLTGYPRESILSGEVSFGSNLIVPEDRIYTQNIVSSALEKKERFALYYRIQCKNGSIKNVWERGEGIFDRDGTPVAIEGFITDMTSLFNTQAELQTTNNTLKNLLDAATQTSVVMTDINGIITTFNRGAENLFGYTAEEVLLKTTPLFLHDPQELRDRESELKEILGRPVKGFEAIIAHAKDGVVERRDWTLVRADGKRLKCQVIVTPVIDAIGKTVGYLGVGQDVTDQRRAEEALRDAKERAEASNRAKDDFLAVISHEMRTPLNPILGFSDLLLLDESDQEKRESLDIIRRSGIKLLRQIEDILDFIGIDKGKTQIESHPIPLFRFCDQLYRDHEALKNSNYFNFQNGCNRETGPIHEGLIVQIDPGKVEQIVSNLITNAFKFTLQGKVTLRVGWRHIHPRYGWFRIEVADSGIGIPNEMRSAIFEPFTQVESDYTRRYEGVGLGLAICSRLVDVMGGAIGFSSEVGHGSTFWIELPAEAEIFDDAEPLLTDEKPVRYDGLNVLVVEDNNDSREVILRYLKQLGANSQDAIDGPSAIERCQQERFDMILMDISMPGMDGFETTREILKIAPDQPLPKIIAITAHVTEEARRMSIDSGMVDFVSKPVTVDKLGSAIEHQLDRS
ncbi:MAG: ATP-binding protein [Verrucomicrobiota bacterium]